MHSNRYTIIFALLVCVTCSVILALTAGGLKPAIRKNEEFDVHRNILKALNLPEDGRSLTPDETETLYAERITEYRVTPEGSVVAASEALPEPGGTREGKPEQQPGDATSFPLFVRKDGSAIGGYCIPVTGKGLWSTIYGYLAIEADGETVKGIRFYKHGETPGLGGEIEAAWFTDNFVGKKIFGAAGELKSITIVKGAVPADEPESSRIHKVDGISGATMTGKAVTVFLKTELQKYEAFFSAVRRGESPLAGEI